jgi:hypothetical protein
MSIWGFVTRLTRRLLVWSAWSILVSALAAFSVNPFLRGLAIQFFAWGAIDGAIALFGAHASARRQAKIQQSERAEVETRETRWLSRVLWINTGLDVFYILGGLWLLQARGADSLLWRGHGAGIMLQGAFLFLFDFYHARVLRNAKL